MKSLEKTDIKSINRKTTYDFIRRQGGGRWRFARTHMPLWRWRMMERIWI